FETAKSVRSFFAKHKYLISYERIIKEFESSPNFHDRGYTTMNEYFEDLYKEIQDDVNFEGKENIIVRCKEEMNKAKDSLSESKSFQHGINELNATINVLSLLEYFRIYYETLYNDLKNGDIEDTYLLDQ